MQVSLEQVHRLAPDEKALSSARELLPLRFWKDLGFSAEAIWGRCRGSGIYDVKIALEDLTVSCPCPSRKHPCRHGLGLLLLFATSIEALPEGPPPEWVQVWLDKRNARTEKARQRDSGQNPPIDFEARQKRMARREARIAQGLTSLQLWLEDLIRHGLASLESDDAARWEDQTRRLVDAQAPGLAARVRQLAEIPGSGEDWPSRLLAALGKLQLLLQACQRLAQLPDDLQAEVRQLVGWNIQLTDLHETNDQLEDDWIVLGQHEEEEERFRVQRTWLMGTTSHRPALILQFTAGMQPFPETLIPGTVESGTLLFYPGTSRLRARLVARGSETSPVRERPPALVSINALLDDYAQRLAQQPWLGRMGALLEDVTLTPSSGRWFVRDRDGWSLPIASAPAWGLLAVTGGRPFDLFGEWNGSSFLPLAHFTLGIYHTI